MRAKNIAIVAVVTILFSGLTTSLNANDKKPSKETPRTSVPVTGENVPASSGNNVNANGNSNKVQEPIPAPTPTSQPIESVSTKSVASVDQATTSNIGGNKPENSASPASTYKPENSANPASVNKPENSANPVQSSKPNVAAESNSTQSTTPGKNLNSLSTNPSTKDVVVKASDFKNSRLEVGRFAANKVNAAASKVEKQEADQSCGVSPKTSTASTPSPTSGKSAAPNAKKNTASLPANAATTTASFEECKDYILVFSDDATSADIDLAANESKGKVLRKFNKVFKGALINGPISKIEALSKNPKVLLIEQDGKVTKQDVYVNPVWGLDRIDQRNLPLSTTYDDLNNSGNTIPVYVVDTGIYAEHSEFAGRVAAGVTTISDGYGSFDCNGHGTHVAGTIAGKNYGIAKAASLIPIRVLDCSGSGTFSGVIAGLDWIAANHPTGVPAVVNMSLGGPPSSSLDSAVNNLISRGITVVVAAGNSSADACNYSPARVNAAITVAATSIDDSRASYSNYGSCIDVFAPGSSITSAWISGTTGTATLSGTSMATPHVTGTIARFLYTNPISTPFQVSNSMTKSATFDVVSNIGPGSANRLLFWDIVFDPTTAPTTSSPSTTKPSNSKKTTNPGKGNKG